jgi:hypothetical protein
MNVDPRLGVGDLGDQPRHPISRLVDREHVLSDDG